MIENELTFPTAEKKSSRSRALILAASCIQKTVRASLSSGVRLSIGCLTKRKTKNQHLKKKKKKKILIGNKI